MAYQISSGQISSGVILTGDFMQIDNGGIASDTVVSTDAKVNISGDGREYLLIREYNSGCGGMGNWFDLNARIETDMRNCFDIIA